MHPRLQEITTYLDAQRASVLAAAGMVPIEQWGDRPAGGAWTVAQVLEHLRLSEAGVVRLAFKLGKPARAAGARAETSTASMLGSLDHLFGGHGIMDRSLRREAPEQVCPGYTVDAHSVVGGLTRTRDDLYAAVALVDGLALEDLRWTHAILGELNLYQWILFLGQHEARHAMQVAEIGRALATREAAESAREPAATGAAIARV